MKTTATFLSALLLATGVSLALPAAAHPGGDCMGAGPMSGERGHGMRGERMQQHRQQLHDALKLNPEQEKAWTKYQEAQADAFHGQRPDRADFDKLTAPERAEKMLEQMKKHEEAMTRQVAALKGFYSQLTPEQQKTFNEQHQHRPQRGQRPAGNAPAPATGAPAAR